MTTRKDVDSWIKIRMDTLESLLKQNAHLQDKRFVESVLDSCSTLYTHMEEGDKDYYEHASWAVEHNKEWT